MENRDKQYTWNKTYRRKHSDKAAENLIKRSQNEENKNVDQLQLKSLANPVNIETISKFIQSIFNNPVSVTNDNDKI